MRDPVSNVPQTSQAVPSGRTPSLGRTIPQLTMRGCRSWWRIKSRGAGGLPERAGCARGDRSKKEGAFAPTLYRIWSTKFPHFFERIAGDAPLAAPTRRSTGA